VSERPYLSLIYPAYNEAATIAGTLEKTVAYFRTRGIAYQIIVAADGNDGTRELARRAAAGDPAIEVIGGEGRRGKGRAVREAAALACGKFVGYADADYKVPIEEFDKLEPWLKQGYDVVTGSRALQQSVIARAQPLYRRVGSRGFRLFMRAVIGLWCISDSQCGFKFFRREAAQELFARQTIEGYMFDVELLALAELFGFRIKEVPIRWQDDGDSRLELLSGNLRNVADIFRIRASRAEYRNTAAAVKSRVRGET
jgi:dolichyl-phosphate beta-glucosyltransferase